SQIRSEVAARPQRTPPVWCRRSVDPPPASSLARVATVSPSTEPPTSSPRGQNFPASSIAASLPSRLEMNPPNGTPSDAPTSSPIVALNPSSRVPSAPKSPPAPLHSPESSFRRALQRLFLCLLIIL